MSDHEQTGEAVRLEGEQITLRDAIALRVLPDLLKNPETEVHEDVDTAYLIADLMMKARARR
jgi:hypothetical protein